MREATITLKIAYNEKVITKELIEEQYNEMVKNIDSELNTDIALLVSSLTFV